MDMHKNFAEWYRLVSIEPKGDVLKSRWAGFVVWRLPRGFVAGVATRFALATQTGSRTGIWL